MVSTVENILYSANGEFGMTKKSIPANVDTINFKSESDCEKAYNKQIELFNYSNSLVEGEVDDVTYEKEIEAYNKEASKTWKNIGLTAAGIGLTLAGIFLTRKLKMPPNTIKPRCLGNGLKLTQKNAMGYIYYTKFCNKEVRPMLGGLYWHTFLKEVNPKTLKECTLPIKESIHLSNFGELNGSLAVSSGFDGSVLTTDGLFQCAGLSIVDKSKKIQSLVHCYFNEAIPDMRKMLKYILKHSKPENLEISIIPGNSPKTAYTIHGINDLIKEIYPNVKINYMNFPATTERTGKLAVVLKNGEVSFCNTDLIQNKIVNPMNKILYFNN